jgi:hypothetical protein
MRRYDPRFLGILGRTTSLHNVDRQDARKCLYETDLLLDKFLMADSQEHFGLNEITINAARQVLTFVRPFLSEPTFPGDDQQFNAWKGLFLPALDHFESALSVDIEAQPIVLLENKRGYSVDTLLQSIEEVLPEAERNGLSDFAHVNLHEAGACLVFHRFTGCGYHLARTVEDVARRYYELIKGISVEYLDRNNKIRFRQLAQIAEELQQHLNSLKGESGLLGLIVPALREFCRIYRQPLSHADPELDTLDSNQAEVAFGHAVTVISSMIQDVRNGGPHFSQLCSWTTIFVS